MTMPGCGAHLNDGREAVSPIVAVAGKAAHPRTVPADHQPVAVMLDFVDPQRAIILSVALLAYFLYSVR